MQADSRIQGLEQRVALSGFELKGALARLTPPAGLKGEAGLFLGQRGFKPSLCVVGSALDDYNMCVTEQGWFFVEQNHN